MPDRPKCVIITGPTASGKTRVSVELAKVFKGEVINADSMQIYSEMMIGTARPTEEEQQGIPHHLFGHVRPDEPYNVSLYRSDAENEINRLIAINKLPIIAGGTGLYINSLIYDLDFNNETDKDLRSRFEEIYDSDNGPETLYRQLKELDPDAAERIHINDKKRLIRRLEILNTNGSKDYDFYRKQEKYDFLILAITKDREELYGDIEKRIDIMMYNGLEEEAHELYIKYGEGINAFAAIGYKEFIPYFNGQCSLNDVVTEIKKNTRHLAKRQITWFKKNSDIKWFNFTEYNHDLHAMLSDIISNVRNFIDKGKYN